MVSSNPIKPAHCSASILSVLSNMNFASSISTARDSRDAPLNMFASARAAFGRSIYLPGGHLDILRSQRRHSTMPVSNLVVTLPAIAEEGEDEWSTASSNDATSDNDADIEDDD